MSTVPPADPRFPNLTRGFNQRFIAHPTYVQVCPTPDDVVEAVRTAFGRGLRITVRGGGHCYENFVYGNDGGVILDLTPMRGVYVDDATGWYVIEAGATLFDVYLVLEKQFGVTIPGGSCYSVGAGGHIAGGGYGLLSRKYGLTVDHLTAVEVVHVDRDGNVGCDVFRGDTGDRDEWLMLWGNKGGGGGNFGVVTKFFFADPPPAPSEALLATEAYPWDGFTLASLTAFLQSYGQFFIDHKDPGPNAIGELFTLLCLTCQPAPQITLTMQLVGDTADALEGVREQLRPARVTPEPVTLPVGYHGIPLPTIDVQVLPWLTVTQTLNGTGNPRRGKYGSAYMIGNFTDAECEIIYRNLRQLTYQNAQALLQVDSYGGQVNAVAPDATAVPQRSSAVKLQYQTYWQDEADDSVNLGWLAEFYGEMYGPNGPEPDGRLDGCYVNYPDANLNNWQHLYYKQNYDQLQEVKARWDPLNVFNHVQSVELP
ncbi:MAG: FAD-dependent oxidoreductase [Acidimicrobiales bacterium]